ncbi:Virulence protein [compost metagenome]
MKIEGIDHLVLTVTSINQTITFYTEVLSMTLVEFGQGRKALQFGQQKINLHEKGNEYEPKALMPTPGSADLCFLVSTPLEEVIQQLLKYHIPIEEGPVARTGAQGPILSVYVRDPDNNLIELANIM